MQNDMCVSCKRIHRPTAGLQDIDHECEVLQLYLCQVIFQGLNTIICRQSSAASAGIVNKVHKAHQYNFISTGYAASIYIVKSGAGAVCD